MFFHKLLRSEYHKEQGICLVFSTSSGPKLITNGMMRSRGLLITVGQEEKPPSRLRRAKEGILVAHDGQTWL